MEKIYKFYFLCISLVSYVYGMDSSCAARNNGMPALRNFVPGAIVACSIAPRYVPCDKRIDVGVFDFSHEEDQFFEPGAVGRHVTPPGEIISCAFAGQRGVLTNPVQMVDQSRNDLVPCPVPVPVVAGSGLPYYSHDSSLGSPLQSFSPVDDFNPSTPTSTKHRGWPLFDLQGTSSSKGDDAGSLLVDVTICPKFATTLPVSYDNDVVSRATPLDLLGPDTLEMLESKGVVGFEQQGVSHAFAAVVDSNSCSYQAGRKIEKQDDPTSDVGRSLTPTERAVLLSLGVPPVVEEGCRSRLYIRSFSAQSSGSEATPACCKWWP